MISEAIVAGAPVVASRIAGNVGLLGADYPGYFEVGDTAALAGLLLRAETDYTLIAELKSRCETLSANFDPASERRAWSDLIESDVSFTDPERLGRFRA